MLTRVVVGCCMMLAITVPAFAKSGVRFTPDGGTILVNKNLGSEHWAITLDPERGSIAGNVFIEGRDPGFVWCAILDVEGDPGDLAAETLVTHCFGASKCADGSQCLSGFDEWHSLGEVRLPGSFFLP